MIGMMKMNEVSRNAFIQNAIEAATNPSTHEYLSKRFCTEAITEDRVRKVLGGAAADEWIDLQESRKGFWQKSVDKGSESV